MTDKTSSPELPVLPAPVPPISPETEPFWAATTEGSLSVPRCRDCDQFFWYPRAVCPFCHSFSVELTPVSGHATIYSFTITRRGAGPYADAAPYVLAYVELDEGIRLLTNIVDADPGDVRIGMSVQVVFHSTEGAAALPRFAPTDQVAS